MTRQISGVFLHQVLKVRNDSRDSLLESGPSVQVRPLHEHVLFTLLEMLTALVLVVEKVPLVELVRVVVVDSVTAVREGLLGKADEG